MLFSLSGAAVYVSRSRSAWQPQALNVHGPAGFLVLASEIHQDRQVAARRASRILSRGVNPPDDSAVIR